MKGGKMIQLSLGLGLFGVAIATFTALLTNPNFATESTLRFFLSLFLVFATGLIVAARLKKMIEDLLRKSRE